MHVTDNAAPINKAKGLYKNDYGSNVIALEDCFL